MGLESWSAFVLASIVLLAMPGPTVLLVIDQSISTGQQGGGPRAWRRSTLPLVAGVAPNDLTAMTLSPAGLGAVLAASCAALARRCSGAVARPGVRRVPNRGTMLIGAGLATAAMRRSAATG